MRKFKYPTGTIVQLDGVYHVGIVFDKYNSIELIAWGEHKTSDLLCKLILINLQTTTIHPVTNKPPSYTLKDFGRPSTTSELKQRLKKIRPKYEGMAYDKFKNNCQHFAYELATGMRKSPDADPWKWASGVLNTFSKIGDLGDSSNSLISLETLQGLQQNLHTLTMF